MMLNKKRTFGRAKAKILIVPEKHKWKLKVHGKKESSADDPLDGLR